MLKAPVGSDVEYDKFVQHQKNLIQMRHLLQHHQLEEVVKVFKCLQIKDFGGPDKPAHSVETVGDLINLLTGYGGYKNRFEQEVLPAGKRFSCVALVAHGFGDYAENIKYLENGKDIQDAIAPLVQRHPFLYDQKLDDCVKLAQDELEKKVKHVEGKISEYVETAGFNQNDKESVKHFLDGKWYSAPQQQASSHVTQMRDALEKQQASNQGEEVIRTINDDPPKRTFTTKQLQKINDIYQRSLDMTLAETLCSIGSTTAKLLEDPERTAEVVGHGERGRNLNHRPGDTETKKGTKEKLAELSVANPDIRAQLHVDVKIKQDIREMPAFIKGAINLFNKLIKDPFNQWLEKKKC